MSLVLRTLRSLCEDLDILFKANMAEDVLKNGKLVPQNANMMAFGLSGWYESVTLKSTGFSISKRVSPMPISYGLLYDLLGAKSTFYNMLRPAMSEKTSSLLKSRIYPEPDFPVPANKIFLAWVGDEIVPS
ncbi:hypothetical protein CUMW_253610 [Citrus unshiu]|uniref:Uncharacterized protein n=1 Tax=Citrus unshiu TaxID=55188 RepID=A0A2H5QR52_CITUN|nr:hypothetical protein CUMW_253610 [Citrus unshiu]